jgi:IclR family transcriptional regulator, KDG regulon repressor
MKSLNKALDILEAFLTSGEDPIGLSDLAKMAGLNKSTASHIVSALVRRNYLIQLGSRGKYSLGMKFLNYSWVITQRIKIRDIAAQYLSKLNEQIGESVFLAVWDGENASFVESLPSKHQLQVIPDHGTNIPLYCSASGKIFLAFNKTEAELEEYFTKANIRAYTDNTITELENLKPHLSKIAQEGIAYSDAERYQEARSVASAIRDVEGKVTAAVGVVAPSIRFTRKRLHEITPDVKRCAFEISRELGYGVQGKSREK